MVRTTEASLHLRRGMQLAMQLTQQVCQDKRIQKMAQDGRLSAATELYEWACQADDILRPPTREAW